MMRLGISFLFGSKEAEWVRLGEPSSGDCAFAERELAPGNILKKWHSGT